MCTYVHNLHTGLLPLSCVAFLLLGYSTQGFHILLNGLDPYYEPEPAV